MSDQTPETSVAAGHPAPATGPSAFSLDVEERSIGDAFRGWVDRAAHRRPGRPAVGARPGRPRRSSSTRSATASCRSTTSATSRARAPTSPSSALGPGVRAAARRDRPVGRHRRRHAAPPSRRSRSSTATCTARCPRLLWWSSSSACSSRVALAVWLKAWSAAVVVALGWVLVVTNLTQHLFLALVAAVCIGAAIGVLNGYLVAKVGIPSFVVTLALFLAWQGVLQFALSGQPINTSNYDLWYNLAYGNLSVTWSWVFTIVVVGGYVAYTLCQVDHAPSAQDLAHDASAWCCCAAACSPWSAIADHLPGLPEPRHHPTAPKQGIPAPAVIAIVLMILCTIALTKTTWGRHLYATGGNAEAARRAGIDVAHIKVTAFVLCSAFGALGGILLASSQSSALARPRLRQRPAVLGRRGGHRRYVALRWPRQAARRHHRRPGDRDHPQRAGPQAQPRPAVAVGDHRRGAAARRGRRRDLASPSREVLSATVTDAAYVGSGAARRHPAAQPVAGAQPCAPRRGADPRRADPAAPPEPLDRRRPRRRPGPARARRGGRPERRVRGSAGPRTWSPRTPPGPYAVGVDIDIAHVTVAAIGLGGSIAAREVIATDRRRAARRPGRAWSPRPWPGSRSAVASPGGCAGSGVSVPGTVDVTTALRRGGAQPGLGGRAARRDARGGAAARVPVVLGQRRRPGGPRRAPARQRARLRRRGVPDRAHRCRRRHHHQRRAGPRPRRSRGRDRAQRPRPNRARCATAASAAASRRSSARARCSTWPDDDFAAHRRQGGRALRRRPRRRRPLPWARSRRPPSRSVAPSPTCSTPSTPSG